VDTSFAGKQHYVRCQAIQLVSDKRGITPAATYRDGMLHACTNPAPLLQSFRLVHRLACWLYVVRNCINPAAH
jgi:hypothetical protein